VGDKRVCTVGAVVMIVACLAATGCSGQDAGPAPTPRSTIASHEVVDPQVALDSTTLDRYPVRVVGAASASRRDLISLPWVFGRLDDSRKRLELVFVAGDGDCVLPYTVTASRTGRRVVVTALSTRDASRTACADRLVAARTTITLPVAIQGGTELVHAVVDPNWVSTATTIP